MKKWPGMAPNGVRRVFFLLIQTLPTFWAEQIWILRISVFFIFWIPNFWISRSPDFPKSGLVQAWARLGRSWAGPGSEIAGGGGGFSAAAPDHKVGEIQGTRTLP